MTTRTSHTTGAAVTTDIASATFASPIGPLRVTATGRGVRSIAWPDARAPDGVEPADTSVNGEDHPVLAAAGRQLGEYFAGERRDFDVPLDPVGTEFQRHAWAALRSIPFGETVTYGEQAERMGDRRKARAVGAANGANPIPIVVPCHRVVGSDGSLTGFAGGLDTKRWLLDHEALVAGRTLV